MTAALALPAAKLALDVAAGLASGIASALDPAKAKAKQTADDFESVFLETMTDKLFASAETEGPLGENGTGGSVYRSMLTQEYARSLQKAGGLGLSDQVMRDLIQLQERAATGGAVHAGR